MYILLSKLIGSEVNCEGIYLGEIEQVMPDYDNWNIEKIVVIQYPGKSQVLRESKPDFFGEISKRDLAIQRNC